MRVRHRIGYVCTRTRYASAYASLCTCCVRVVCAHAAKRRMVQVGAEAGCPLASPGADPLCARAGRRQRASMCSCRQNGVVGARSAHALAVARGRCPECGVSGECACVRTGARLQTAPGSASPPSTAPLQTHGHLERRGLDTSRQIENSWLLDISLIVGTGWCGSTAHVHTSTCNQINGMRQAASDCIDCGVVIGGAASFDRRGSR